MHHWIDNYVFTKIVMTILSGAPATIISLLQSCDIPSQKRGSFDMR